MITKKTLVTLTVTLLLASPVATATWMAYGTHEPDNAEDSSSFMFFDPPTTPGAKAVYFNGWTQAASLVTLTLNGQPAANPNLGVIGSRNEVPTGEVYKAILGVWLDCNGDGYIGMAETAVREYESALLTDTTVCPPLSGLPNEWNGAHNYRGWVTELIPIGNTGGDAADDGNDLRVYRDADVRMWGDLSRPNEPAAAGGSVCPVFAPRGTHESTGGILTHYDCLTAVIDRWNQVWRDGFRVNGQDTVPGLDESNSLGLHFASNNDARQNGHPLHQQTLGSENSENSAVYYADCDADPIVRVNSTETVDETGAPIGGQLDGFEFTQQPLNPRTGSADPNAAGTVNATSEEVLGDCDYENDGGRDTYGNLEADTQATLGNDKRKANLQFSFADANRGDANPAFAVLHGGRSGMPGHAGLLTTGDWSGNSFLIKTTGPRTVRANLAQGAVEVAPPQYITYYASVGENITAGGFALPGGSGIYGSAQCGSETSGIWNGWNCDADLWNRNPNTGEPLDGTENFAKPGDAYQLRDVDCSDGGNSLGIPLGVPALGAAPCAPHP